MCANQIKTCLLVHIPHSSIAIPEEERREILLDNTVLDRELLKLTDRYTDELYNFPGAVMHRNRYSRILFDPERFRNDSDESMSRYGMGVIYTHTLNGDVLRCLSDERREELIQKYYDPYHKELEDKVAQILDVFGRCLIVDGHSFPNEPLEFESDKVSARPDICIGTDSFHTPVYLHDHMIAYIKANNLIAHKDFPFSGAIVPSKYYRKDKRVASVMIEINRRLYMDEKTGDRLQGQGTIDFDYVKDFINRLIAGTYEIFAKHA